MPLRKIKSPSGKRRTAVKRPSTKAHVTSNTLGDVTIETKPCLANDSDTAIRISAEEDSNCKASELLDAKSCPSPSITNDSKSDHSSVDQGNCREVAVPVAIATDVESCPSDSISPKQPCVSPCLTPNVREMKRPTAHIITTPTEPLTCGSRHKQDEHTGVLNSPVSKLPRMKPKSGPAQSLNSDSKPASQGRGRPRKLSVAPKSNGTITSLSSSVMNDCNRSNLSLKADSLPGKRNNEANPAETQKQITEYFPVRRSGRKISADIKKHHSEELEYYIESQKQDGLDVQTIVGKGRGIVSTRPFRRNEFVVEYAGDLVEVAKAKELEVKYLSEQKGCYMYYFSHNNKNYCVDATEESGLYGRLINHSRRKPNCHMKIVEVKCKPRLILKALRDIESGEEILYDYGDRSKEALDAHPWLAL